jgi:hypothetical protein
LKVDPDLLKTRLYYRLHGAAVKEMTDGKKIFGENRSPAMEEFGKFVKKGWYPTIKYAVCGSGRQRCEAVRYNQTR